MEYIYRRKVIHSELLAAGQRSITINHPFNNRIPPQFQIFMIYQTADSGTYNKDPFYYRSNGLINYRIMINGETFRDTDCSAEDGYVNVYQDSLIAHSAQDGFIPFKMFKNGSFVISVATNHSQTGHLSYEQKENMSVHLRFQNPIAQTQIVFIVGTVHSTFEITADRNCISNYGY